MIRLTSQAAKRYFFAGKKMAHNGVGQMGFIKGVGSIYPA